MREHARLGSAPVSDSATPAPGAPDFATDVDRSANSRHPGRGDQAPGFELEGIPTGTYRLADHAGEPVVLVFYPADNSPICTQQLRSYSEDLGRFEAFGATVLCLSPQDVATHEKFAVDQGLRVPLLADVGAEVGKAYNILGPLGFYRRSVFVVDGDGVIRYARRSLSSLTYVPADQLIDAVRSVAAS
jgi:thioredoxin-dependent peroxiredoxin